MINVDSIQLYTHIPTVPVSVLVYGSVSVSIAIMLRTRLFSENDDMYSIYDKMIEVYTIQWYMLVNVRDRDNGDRRS